MQALSGTLTLASPVRVDILGAHLESYLNTLPVVNTLKLCNTYGKGDQAAITRLPVELILCVADHIVQEERQNLAVEWKQDYRCFQRLCDSEDHLSEDDIHELTDYLLSKDWGGCEGIREHLDFIVHDHLDGHLDEWIHVHDSRSESWKSRIGMSDSHNLSFFEKHAGQILKTFGLNVWTTQVRLASHLPQQPWVGVDYGNLETTVAWLEMPRKWAFERELQTSAAVQEHIDWEVEDGGEVVLSPPRSAKSARATFRRATMLLGVEPHLHPGQREFILGEEEDSIDTKWPKLVTLIKSKPSGMV